MARGEGGRRRARPGDDVLDQEEMLDKPSPISLEDATVVRLRALLQKAQADAKPGIKLERALEKALESRKPNSKIPCRIC